MFDLVKDLGRQLLNELVDRVRDLAGGQKSPAPPHRPPEPAHTTPLRPAASPAPAPPSTPASPEAKPKAKPKATAKPAAKKRSPRKKATRKSTSKKARSDQLLRVLHLLSTRNGSWMSAREIADAGEKAGSPILPGNVRKVLRTRGTDLVETRPREGSRRGALEYRLTTAGKARLHEK